MAEPFLGEPNVSRTYGTETWLKFFLSGAADQLIRTVNSAVYANRHARRILQLSNWPKIQNSRPRSLSDPLRKLGSHSPRSVSSILSWTPPQVQFIHWQEQCLLLTRLPIDIRLIVYKEVLRVPNELEIGFHKHETIEPNGTMRRKWKLRILDKSNRWTEKHKLLRYGTLRTQQLPLLTACRLIYREAISTLYSSNSFHFEHFGQQKKLHCFLSQMPTHRIQDIKRLRLNYWLREFPPTEILDIKEWNDMWHFLSTTLHQLQVFTLSIVTTLRPQAALDRLSKVDHGWLEPTVRAPMPVKLQFKALVTDIRPEQDLDVEASKRKVIEVMLKSSIEANASDQLSQCCEALLEDIENMFTSATTKK